ncbi:hypothetical protein HDU82_003848 [Entophlyctis luteolus]|nr:hypothetical protein HDU82_003848 [Entophlyctis luteolus]
MSAQPATSAAPPPPASPAAAHKPPSENSPTNASPSSSKRVYVSNLSFRTTDADLTAAFGAVCPGQVRKATVIKKYGRSKGFGFVTFISNESAQTAVSQMDRIDLGGRTINVRIAIQSPTRRKSASGSSTSPAPPSKKQPPPSKKTADSALNTATNSAPQSVEASAAAARAAINPPSNGATVESPSGGAALDTPQSSTKKPKKRFNKKKQQRPPAAEPASNGDGHVGHQRIDDAANEDDAAENWDAPANVTTNGAQGKQNQQQQRRPVRPKKRPQGPLSKNTLFVSNLPYAIDDQALVNLFSDYGSIEAKVVQRNGQSKGFGFVKLRDESSHQKAMEAFRTETFQVDGRLLVVRAAIEYDAAGTSDSQ